ncbi:hypothetical protein BY996DRAFT_4596991 [Phakopsora pachyrhizi]|uniref:Uncharacterized protein n=1 Tax=Phakopsora pachyrhizi TaxID=170000 RepID=A0AAV0B0P6_PHAPC|nr:hypothetical protein BY996DRAFT_4596991 [Phakopsora pachyrhizi]CAH7675474.1 hypothetical protein PPACK8108_LOCUS10491 [Phakopsora pachyrhizi]
MQIYFKQLLFLKTFAPKIAGKNKVISLAPTNTRATIHYSKYGPNKFFDCTTSKGTIAYDKYLTESIDLHSVTIRDLRGSLEQPELFKDGFTFLKDKVEGLEHCKEYDDYAKLLRPAAEKLVKEKIGAATTVAFGLRRRFKVNRSPTEQDQSAPVPRVHSDWSPEGAEKILKDIADSKLQLPQSENLETFKKLYGEPGSRLLIINVWRPLKNVYRDPLAICNWRSAQPKKNALKVDFFSPTRRGCLQWLHIKEHQWFYHSEQTPDTPVMFLQYDSKINGHYTIPHTSFSDPKYPKDLPPRESFEIRVAAILRDQN